MKQTTATHPRPTRATSAPKPILPEGTPEKTGRGQFENVLIPLDVHNYATAAATLDEMDTTDWIVAQIKESARCNFDHFAAVLEGRNGGPRHGVIKGDKGDEAGQ